MALPGTADSQRVAEHTCIEGCSAFFRSKWFAVALLIASLALFGTGAGIGGTALFGGALKFAATLGTAGGLGIFIPCAVLLAVGGVVGVVLLIRHLSCWVNGDEWEDVPLVSAVKDGDMATVRSLLSRGAKVNVIPRSSKTALFEAVLLGEIEMVKLLLVNGADANIIARGGFTPLYEALFRLVDNGKSEAIVSLLIEYGADYNAHVIDSNDAKNADETTIYSIAQRHPEKYPGRFEMLDKLINNKKLKKIN